MPEEVIHSFNEMDGAENGQSATATRVAPSEMAEKRLDITIRSMAHAAHYVGGIDGKFDRKERKEASDPVALKSNLKGLLVPGNPDDKAAIQRVIYDNPKDVLGNKLEAAIEDIEDQGLSRDELIEAMEQLSEEAKEAGGFLPIIIKSDHPDKSEREQFAEINDEYELGVDISELDEDGHIDSSFYETFGEAVQHQLGEAFYAMLAYNLMYYGTYIGYASGRLFSINPFSEEEVDAIAKVGEIYGLERFQVITSMMAAESKAEMVQSLKDKSFIDQLRDRVRKGLLSWARS